MDEINDISSEFDEFGHACETIICHDLAEQVIVPRYCRSPRITCELVERAILEEVKYDNIAPISTLITIAPKHWREYRDLRASNKLDTESAYTFLTLSAFSHVRRHILRIWHRM